MKYHRIGKARVNGDSGHVLMVALVLIVLFGVMGMTALYLASQDAPGLSAMKEDSAATQMADAAGELIVSWFHDSATTPPPVENLLAMRQGDLVSGPSFFDAAGRSQFVGTAERPDILLDASYSGDNWLLNNPPTGFGGSLIDLGHLEKVKIYAPSEPGLLGTLEVTAATLGRRPAMRTVRLQLGALKIPAVRAAVQIGKGLGTKQPGGESPVLAHWGDVRVMGDLVLNKAEDAVVKTDDASVTGQPYDLMERREDRWADYWIGGQVTLLTLPSSTANPVLPSNMHLNQLPTPGLRMDQWDYDLLKKTALRHGSYYRLDRMGRLHPFGEPDSDPGLSPYEVLESTAVGQSQGLVFIDTVDGKAPSSENLGTLVIESEYVEALLVVQGHVILRSQGTGRSVPVLSPSPEGSSTLGSRIPVTLSGIHLNGLLFSAGDISLERSIRVYGAVMTPKTVATTNTGTLMEVWYDTDFGKGRFRGLPIVYRAPGTWQLRY